MSTKTTFKRIALVAVAALGLGVLSVAPSSAAVANLSVVTTNGTASKTAGGSNETATAAAYVSVAGYATQANESLTVTANLDSFPTGGSAVAFNFGLYDTGTSSTSVIKRGGNTLTAAAHSAKRVAGWDSITPSSSTTGYYVISNSGATGAIGAGFVITVDTATTRVDGDYKFTVVVANYEGATYKSATTYPVTLTISKDASQSTTIDPSKSTAIMSLGSAFVSGTVSDSSVALVSTVSATDQAIIKVVTQNANGTGAAESITATVTGAGVIGLAGGSTFGKNITVAGTGSTDLAIRADGTAGVGSIVIKTTTVTFAAKTVTFYAKAAKTITLAVAQPVIGVVSATDVIRATAVDADGNVWGGAAYIYADTAADALIASSATPVACTFNAAKAYHECPVAGTAAGTANLKVIDAATVALATATSASAAVRVTTGTPAKATIAFDKATYAPGEKAQIWVTATDAAGLALSARTITNIFASGGITSSTAFSSGSATLTSTDAVIEGASSSSSNKVAGYQVYIVYMPMSSGTVTISATGSTGLALAGRVALSASAEVVNSSVDAATDAANEATDAANAATDAALAAADAADAATAAAQDASDAVAALSASVSKLISSLRAQITSLTNLVIKIQKKVKA
jgi:hypothetical protein